MTEFVGYLKADDTVAHFLKQGVCANSNTARTARSSKCLITPRPRKYLTIAKKPRSGHVDHSRVLSAPRGFHQETWEMNENRRSRK